MNFNKIKEWFSKKDNLILLGIILFAAIIRIYFFYLTKNQPIWWDESDYLAYAKTLAGMGSINWIVTSQHNSIFSFILAFFFTINFSEALMKFILEIIPSTIIVILTYLISRAMYLDKRIAYISAFIMAVFWEGLFNSMRFHVDIPALFFAFLAIYSFFQGYEKKQKIFSIINPNWAIPLAVIFTIISYSIRRNYLFFGAFFITYLLITKKYNSLIKDKYNWIGLAIGLLLLLFVELFIFNSSLTSVAGEYYHPENSFNWKHLSAFSLFFLDGNVFQSIFLWFTYFGLLIVLFNLFFSYDILREQKLNDSKSDLFLILSIVISLSYFIFFQRGTTIGETRWYYPILLPALIFISRGILYLGDKINQYKKGLSLIFVLIILSYGGYYQLSHANQIISEKIPTYEGIREAGLYLNQVSNVNDVIISVPIPQAAYYSERFVVNPASLFNRVHNDEVSLEEFISKLEQNNSIKYLLISFSEPNHPSWMRNEQEEYAYDSNGQVIRAKLEIPFMDTIINFQTGEQKITQEKTYNDITFKLIQIKQDVFIYEILRNSQESPESK